MKLVLAFLLCYLTALALGSSHSEAPGTARTPQADNTDFYAFRSYEDGRSDYVVFIMNVHGLQAPFGGPNYFALSTEHFYELQIDNTGDAVEDIIFSFYTSQSLGGNIINTTVDLNYNDCNNPDVPGYQLQYGGIELPIGDQMVPVALKIVGPVTAGDTSSLNWFENYYVNLIQGGKTYNITHDGGNPVFTKPFDYAGTKSFPDYEDYAAQYYYDLDSIPGCSSGTGGRVFVGQRKESFSVNLGRVFDLINFIPIPGFPGAVVNDPANNVISSRSITAFVLEVPISCVVGKGNGVIGAWSTISTLVHEGDVHTRGAQVSRLGQPLVNELVIGLYNKGDFNAATPDTDGQFATYVEYPTLPALVNLLFLDAVQSVEPTIQTLAPTTPRYDLVTVFLTGIAGLNQLKTVTASEVLRLNTSVLPVDAYSQNNLGVIGGDSAGFPNGRRPGDDVVDIALRVVMGALCNPDVAAFKCNATVGNVEFLDGAPISATDFLNEFPWLNTPNPGYGTTSSSTSAATKTVKQERNLEWIASALKKLF